MSASLIQVRRCLIYVWCYLVFMIVSLTVCRSFKPQRMSVSSQLRFAPKSVLLCPRCSCCIGTLRTPLYCVPVFGLLPRVIPALRNPLPYIAIDRHTPPTSQQSMHARACRYCLINTRAARHSDVATPRSRPRCWCRFRLRRPYVCLFVCLLHYTYVISWCSRVR